MLLSSGKKAIGAGAGNPPVVVDDTADIPKAAKDIIDGCTFDNNLPCIAEKECFVMKNVADELIQNMLKNGAYLINAAQVKQLEDVVLVWSKPKKEANSQNVLSIRIGSDVTQRRFLLKSVSMSVTILDVSFVKQSFHRHLFRQNL